jgi:hypothetical protein
MWIEMLETYAGAPGLFLKGLKYDLPESILKQIRVKGRHLWRKCIAPYADASICPNPGVPERPAVHAGEEQTVSNEVR